MYAITQMSFEVQTKTFKWLLKMKALTAAEVKQLSNNSFEIKQSAANQFQNGSRIANIIMELYKARGVPIPASLNHLKQTNGTAAQLYNWNILNDAMKKFDFESDSETKNLIINGDRAHLAMVIRKVIHLFEKKSDMDDSLETDQFQPKNKNQPHNTMKESLTLSKSQQPPKLLSQKANAITGNIGELRKPDEHSQMAQGDLLDFVVNELIQKLKLSRKQAIALLSDNNKYLAHVLVKGVKGQFVDIENLMQKFFSEIDFIVEKMTEQNDMCFYFLQIIKPCLLSKSEQIAQWGCRILTKIAHELAIRQMLPLAYDWFVQEAGGLSTTILALSRHPKLSHHVVGYILEFGRYNVTQLFTIQLKKITNNDNLSYIKFMLLIFNPLVESKISAEELLQSGAIDYWLQVSLKGAENDLKNTKELRMYCIEFLIKLWRAYPGHIQDTLDHVNNIMTQIKKGIRDESQIMRFNLMELMFDLLDEFAGKKNPYASIVYKKITFLFIENHQQLTMRQFILRNLQAIFDVYQSIPVQIFLQPFIKQIKISESRSYVVNIFDMQFINVAVRHKKLKVGVGLQLFDLLAKTKLNSYSFADFASDAMDILLDRFIQEDIFLEYTVKLVKISLAMFYSTLKHKKQYEDQERLQAQKRAQIVNFIISLIERSNSDLNEEIKNLVVHVKVQILNRLSIQHKGIERILGFFSDIDDAIMEAMQNIGDDVSSNANSTKSKSGFHLPKIEPRNMLLRDQTSSQQSLRSSGSKYSQNSRLQFPIKDYTEYASDEEKKFLKENGLGLKKKNMTKKRGPSNDKQAIDPKVQEQITKIKLRKQEEENKKLKQKEYLEKKKQILKLKIQKELEQRNIKQGHKGNEKDVQVRVIFDENQISEAIMEEEDGTQNQNINQEEDRDHQSIKIVLKKYAGFIKKIFNRYSNLKGGKKDYFDGQNQTMNQIDLVRMCKQKNIIKNKNVIVELLKQINNKNVGSLNVETFFRFMQVVCIEVYDKQKCGTNMLMGDLMKKILRRMSQGENFKLDQDDDEVCNNWSQKVRYNPHIELPQNFKKVYERVYKVYDNCSYPVKKAIRAQKYVTCYEVLNEILKGIFNFNIIEEQVRFVEQARVMHKKQYYLPPKPLKKEKQATQAITLLEDKQKPGEDLPRKKIMRSSSKRPDEKENTLSRSKQKIPNQAQKKKLQEQEQVRKKRQIEEELRKQRALEVKKKLQKQTQEREKDKEKKLLEKQEQQRKEEQRIRKQKQKKQQYIRQQKDKVEKYKKEQEEKQKQEKTKSEANKLKEEQEKRAKLKQQMKKQDQRRKQQFERQKKDRELSEEKNKKKIQDQGKKKELLKKQMMRKIEGQKEKLENTKMSKDVIHRIYQGAEIKELLNNKYKEELKAIFNFGKQFNEFKLDKANTNLIEQKGWLSLCQHLSLCDVTTANKIYKVHMKEKNSSGISVEDMQQILFQLAVKKDIEADPEDSEKNRKLCAEKFDKNLAGLKLPKSSQKLKEYFIGLKNQMSKKKEEMAVTNPDGQKQLWQVEDD